MEESNLRYEIVSSKITIKLAKGTSSLLLGSNGAGKSQLLEKIIDKDNVEFIRNGKVLEQNDIFDIIAYVPQKSVVLNGSVLDNLLINIKKSEILEFLKKYPKLEESIKDLIVTNPIITDLNTSKQTQLNISLLRALYLIREREVLIIDEVNNNYIPEILENNKEKAILVAGHYNEEDIKKFDNVFLLNN
ncbi:hypothetical protein NUSPORA_02521 [Nucleospora cyclopteri]